MDHRVDLGMFLEHGIQRLLVRDIDIVEDGLAATDELDAVQDLLRRVVEVVDDNDVVARDEKLQAGEGADVARSSSRKIYIVS
jgi:hypothetical protein